MKKFSALLISIALLFAVSAIAQDTTTAAAGTGQDQTSTLQTKKLIDFSVLDKDTANIEVKKDKWRITLSGLSDNSTSKILSDLKWVDVVSSEVNEPAKAENITRAMGVRINFAYGYNNDWAQIHTEDPISEFKVTEEEGMGVLKNVGAIQSMSVMVRGLNYMHTLEVRTVDRDGNHKDINFGSLYFNGWDRRTWLNPDYIADKKKRDVIKLHLYPLQKPLLRFDSLVVYKAPGEKGGDFIFYVTDVKVTYEPYEVRTMKDIDNEKEWGIQEGWNKEKEKRQDFMRWLKYSGSSLEDEYLKEEAARKAAGK